MTWLIRQPETPDDCRLYNAAASAGRSTSLELLGVTPPGQERFNGWHRWDGQVVSMEMA